MKKNIAKLVKRIVLVVAAILVNVMFIGGVFLICCYVPDRALGQLLALPLGLISFLVVPVYFDVAVDYFCRKYWKFTIR